MVLLAGLGLLGNWRTVNLVWSSVIAEWYPLFKLLPCRRGSCCNFSCWYLIFCTVSRQNEQIQGVHVSAGTAIGDKTPLPNLYEPLFNSYLFAKHATGLLSLMEKYELANALIYELGLQLPRFLVNLSFYLSSFFVLTWDCLQQIFSGLIFRLFIFWSFKCWCKSPV